MPRYTAEHIYAIAREAGFSPDQAATMTAVALAESGGNSGAHNPRGEDSRGLWQINANAHPELGKGDLYDPAQNAKAAFQVSHGGDDISPWTTTHGGLSARYLRHKAEAEAAAAAYGDGPDRGMWAGNSGYGDRTAAGPDGGPPPQTSQVGADAVVVSQSPAADPAAADPGPVGAAGEQYGIALESAPVGPDTPEGISGGSALPVVAAGSGADYGIPLEPLPGAVQPAAVAATTEAAPEAPTGDAATLQAFLDAAMAQNGDQYVFGHETGMDDANPSTFDCSELVEWSAHRAGVEVPDGAWYQYTHLQKGGSDISVEQAIDTPGALLFSFSSDPLTGRPTAAHVAISLGNGKTIEAMGTEYGVGSWDATPRRFQYAALIPGMGTTVPVPPVPPAQPPADSFDQRLGTDPAGMDAQPTAVAASEQLTAAEPAPVPDPAPTPVEPAPAGADPVTVVIDPAADPTAPAGAADPPAGPAATDPAAADPAAVDPAVADPAAVDPAAGTDVDGDGVDDALAQVMHLSQPPMVPLPDLPDQSDHSGDDHDSFSAH